MTRISVIIPCLDEATVIGDLLNDLVPIRAQGHQVILADGGSGDATPDIAAGRVDRVVRSAAGRAIQMNAGARVATGELLWFVHADTRVPTDAPGRLLQACAGGGQWGRFNIRLSGRHPLLRVVETAMNLRSCVTAVATGDQGIFVTRRLFESIGGFPEIPLMEDIALSGQLRQQTRPVCIERPRLQTSSRRWEEQGVLRTIWLMWRLRLAYALGASPADLARHYR